MTDQDQRPTFLAASVRALRAYFHWRQEELAEKAGLSRSQVSLVERGLADNPSHRTIHGIAEAFGVSVDTLTEPWFPPSGNGRSLTGDATE